MSLQAVGCVWKLALGRGSDGRLNKLKIVFIIMFGQKSEDKICYDEIRCLTSPASLLVIVWWC